MKTYYRSRKHRHVPLKMLLSGARPSLLVDLIFMTTLQLLLDISGTVFKY